MKYFAMAMLLSTPAFAGEEPATLSEEQFKELAATKFGPNDVSKFLMFCSKHGGIAKFDGTQEKPKQWSCEFKIK
jgi:hypothetical protein